MPVLKHLLEPVHVGPSPAKVVLAILLVAALLLVTAWLFGRRPGAAKAHRGRLHRPGRWLIPVALVLLAFYGFAVARKEGNNPPVAGAALAVVPGQHFGVPEPGSFPPPYYFVLPLSYLALIAGGWALWRGLDRESPVVRLVLGQLAGPDGTSQPWGMLLLPVAIMAVALFLPGIWFSNGVAGVGWTVALLIGVALVVRRAADGAARLATAGLGVLGIMGLWAAEQRDAGLWHPLMPNGSMIYGAVVVPGGTMAFVAATEAIGFIALSLWLVPRTMPEIRRVLRRTPDAELTSRVQRLAESRAVAVDTAAADLRRLERDLHDGAQARLVALGMSLRAAERLILTSPEAALALVAEARETSARALTELRELVRGVHPPVLADRGLADAVRALALDSPLNVETDVDLPGRLPAPVETACYFAVAELLTNAAKHSGARDARIGISHSAGLLRIEVTDFGLGGAEPAHGSGLLGVEKRLATFDGIMAVSSPAGGPTIVVLEVPCALSSPKISSC